jgi:hypothetical protein
VGAPAATLDKSKPFEEAAPGGHNFEPGEVLLDPDRGHQHATPVGKEALNALNGISDDANEKAKAVSQLYVQQNLKAFPTNYIAQHWDAVRDSYAKSLGYTGGTISEGAFQDLLKKNYQNEKKQVWATALTTERLKMLFGDSSEPPSAWQGFKDIWTNKGGSEPNTELPVIGFDQQKGGMVTISKIQEAGGVAVVPSGLAGGAMTIDTTSKIGGAFVGIMNAVNKAVSSLTTPENVGLMVATGGAGVVADIAQSARVIALAKGTQAAALGTFAAVGAKSTADATAEAIKITHDPNSTHAEIAEAWADAGIAAAMTAAAAKGTYDFGKGAVKGTETEIPPEKKAAAVETLRTEAEKAPTAEMAADLHAAADHIEHSPEEGVTEAQPEAEKPPVEAKPEKMVTVYRGEAPGSPRSPAGSNAGKWFTTDRSLAENAALTSSNFSPDMQGHVYSIEIPESRLKEFNEAATKANGEPGWKGEVLVPDEFVSKKRLIGTIDKEGKVQPVESAPKGVDYGIAARVSEERAGQGAIEPIEPGKGISAEESVLHGRDLLEKGADPQEALDAFQKDGKISADQIALVRAHGETLNKAAYDAEVKYGPDSPEYKEAAKADSDWVKAIKPMQTEWSKIGAAQQGQTEMDTGTFHGVSRAFEESTGRKFTPKEAETAKVKVAKVQEATESLKAATDKFVEGAKAAAEEPKPAEGAKKPSKLSERAAEARARISERLLKAAGSAFVQGEEAGGLLSKENLNDLAVVGADYISKGAREFGAWSEKMVKEFGEKIRDHLNEIFDKAQKEHQADKNAPIMSHVPGEAWTPEQAKALWQHAKEKYLDKGITDPHDIRSNLATDFGLDPDEIHKGLASSKGMKEITDEVYAKQQAQRRVINEAKRWVTDAKYPGYEKFFRAIPESFFNLYTFGHGTVWTVTHTGNQYFLPKATGRLFRELGRSFRLMGVFDGGAYHERMMNDLIRDPNFIKAKRAGLENDPYIQRDEYQNPGVVKMFKQIGLMGNRGFDGMKLFRQFRFNQEWNALPDSLKNADSAKGIAEMINTATGAVPGKAPGGVARTIFFAPRLEMSRWKFMFTDPAKNANTIAKALVDKDSVSPEDYHSAQRNLRQKVTMAGVYFGALAINQGLLEATNSDQKVNFTDFKKSDWLDFKVAGKNVGIVSTMRRTVQFLVELGDAFWGKRTQLEKAEGTRADQAAGIAWNYARSKMSPFAGVTTDILTQSDYIGKPLPFSSDKASPRAKRMGEGKPYTYAEYGTTHLLPIPLAEAAREIWKTQGMDEEEIGKWFRAIEAGIVSGGTGAKMKDDHSKK